MVGSAPFGAFGTTQTTSAAPGFGNFGATTTTSSLFPSFGANTGSTAGGNMKKIINLLKNN